jgi:hypothetical protein
MFIGLRTSAELEFNTPPDFCCNCGSRQNIEFAETPLQKTRYFLFFGTELTLTEYFPYCKPCRRSAKRIKLSLIAKCLVTALLVSVVFLALVLLASSLPPVITANFFYSAVAISCVLSVVYFSWRERSRTGASYYQPVRLLDAEMNGNSLGKITLQFYNCAYARAFAAINHESVAGGSLQVVVDPKHVS